MMRAQPHERPSHEAQGKKYMSKPRNSRSVCRTVIVSASLVIASVVPVVAAQAAGSMAEVRQAHAACMAGMHRFHRLEAQLKHDMQALDAARAQGGQAEKQASYRVGATNVALDKARTQWEDACARSQQAREEAGLSH
jgi:hypothetical protein